MEMTAVEPIGEKDPESNNTPTPAHKISLPNRFMRRLGRTRYSGLFFGPLYGVLIYLYITFLILPGRPFIHTDQDKDFNQLMTEETGHIVGGGIGIASGVGLTVASIPYRRVRCTMVLIIPTLLTRRGRALLITLSIGLLVQGPVRTLRRNIEEIGSSFTCMLDEVSKLASHILSQFGIVLSQFQIILEEITVLLKLYIERLEADLSDEAKQELAEAKQSIEKIKTAATKAANAISFPDSFCSGMLSSSTAMGTKIKKLAEDFKVYVLQLVGGNTTGGRKKRDVCASAIALGEVAIKDLTEGNLKEFLTKIGADVDFSQIKTKEQLAAELDTTSIEYIRNEFKDLFETSLNSFLIFTVWASKVLYLTILLLIYDAHDYLSQHYSDDTFDNMMVDDNLKRLKRKKLTPLRQWEIQEQYYHATDVTLTSQELINVLILSLSSVFSTLFVTLVVVADYLLSAALLAFKDNSKLAVSFPSLESGESFSSQLDSPDQTITVEAYDLSLDPCIPDGKKSPPRFLWPLYIVLFICLLSCALEAYFSRMRAAICNAFYEKRAEERAIYLYE